MLILLVPSLAVLFNLFDTNASETVSRNQFKSTSIALFEMQSSHGGFNGKGFSKMLDAYVYFAFLNVSGQSLY